MARDNPTGLFCCQASYNTTSEECGVSTRNSNSPFQIANAGVIFNRTSGSTDPNATLTSIHTVTATATATVLAGTAGSNSGKEVGLGVGLGVSLGTLLILTLALLWRSIKQRKNLQQVSRSTLIDETLPALGDQVYEPKPELEARTRAELEGPWVLSQDDFDFEWTP